VSEETRRSRSSRPPGRDQKRRRSARATVGLLVGTVLLSCAALVALVAVVVPAVGGATTYTVLTRSMEPGLPPGTLLVVRPTPVDDLRVGDVITFQLESGKPTVVTHRITEVQLAEDDERLFTTQGDANANADPEPVMPVQVRGSLWYAIPYLGWVSSLRSSDAADVWIPVVAGLVLCYAAVMVVGAVRDRRRRADEPDRDGQGYDGRIED
jgi:signal peptidase